MAKEFGFHQSLRNGRAVDGNKGLLLSGAFVVNGFCDEVLAGATFALNQNGGGLAGRDLFDEVQKLRDLRRNTDHATVTGTASNLAAQGLDFGA